MNIETSRGLIQAFQSTIAELPEIGQVEASFQQTDGQRCPNASIQVQRGDERIKLIVETKAGGYPRDVQQAALQIRELTSETQAEEALGVYLAPSISESSRTWLREHGIAYWDSSGSLFLRLPWGVFWIDRPVPRGAPRRLTRIFAGRSSQVIHAMLLEPKRSWHVQELAKHAAVSPSTVHQVFRELEEHLWAEKQGRGPASVRVLTDPGALLDAWQAEHSLKQCDVLRFHRWSRLGNDDLLKSLTQALHARDIDYALTLSSGAQFIAPFASASSHVAALVPSFAELADFVEQAGFRQVDEGENVLLFGTESDGPLLFRQRQNDFWVASNVQLYLDLYAWPQRGKEQAAHLRNERLGY